MISTHCLSKKFGINLQIIVLDKMGVNFESRANYSKVKLFVDKSL